MDTPLLDYTRLDRAEVSRHWAKAKLQPVFNGLIRAFYEAVLTPGAAAIDVGVHYGHHLFPMRDCVGESGIVFGIEANVERYVAIQKRIANRNLINVHLLNVAASDTQRVADFYVNMTHTGRSGLRDNRANENDDVRKLSVYTVPISSVIPRSIAPAFIKIDIEGAEFPALVGAKDVMMRGGAIVVFEGRLATTAPQFGFSARDVEAFAKDIDYAMFDFFGNAMAPGSETDGIGWNYVLCPNDAARRARVAGGLTEAWLKVLAAEKSQKDGAAEEAG